jgi:Tol biopolymer transport system component
MSNNYEKKSVNTVNLSKNLSIGIAIVCICLFSVGCHFSGNPYGIFEQQSDIGEIKYAGTTKYDSSLNEYHITGSGENIWGEKDAFCYIWKRIRGDVELTADICWFGKGKHEHRKAGWMIRQSLDADSPYVDAVAHGSGLISLQYRSTKGGPTEEIQSPIPAPATLKLTRDGDVFSLYVSKDGNTFHPAGAVCLALAEPVYAGLAVCSHNNTTTETAIFKNVEMKLKGVYKVEERVLESNLEIIDIETGVRKIIYSSYNHFEAPNWSRDGKYLLVNGKGKLFTIGVDGGEPKQLNTEFAVSCNNDHGFSPDGELIAISHHHKGVSLIYVLPSEGGTPRQVTESGPSYWHGWSPDGKTLAYCAERNGNYDIYVIPVTGGQELRLTDAEGPDDGPDYSHDGRYIYFNSQRTGVMRIWKMDADGRNQKQITFDEQYADWFPHPSPDGKWIVFLSYDRDVEGHPANKEVTLRIMPTSGDKPRVLTKLFGGQGTINVPSWSPDSKYVAFVSYRLAGANP